MEPTPTKTRSPRRKWLFIGGGFIGLTVIVALALFLSQSSSDPMMGDARMSRHFEEFVYANGRTNFRTNSKLLRDLGAQAMPFLLQKLQPESQWTRLLRKTKSVLPDGMAGIAPLERDAFAETQAALTWLAFVDHTNAPAAEPTLLAMLDQPTRIDFIEVRINGELHRVENPTISTSGISSFAATGPVYFGTIRITQANTPFPKTQFQSSTNLPPTPPPALPGGFSNAVGRAWGPMLMTTCRSSSTFEPQIISLLSKWGTADPRLMRALIEVDAYADPFIRQMPGIKIDPSPRLLRASTAELLAAIRAGPPRSDSALRFIARLDQFDDSIHQALLEHLPKANAYERADIIKLAIKHLPDARFAARLAPLLADDAIVKVESALAILVAMGTNAASVADSVRPLLSSPWSEVRHDAALVLWNTQRDPRPLLDAHYFSVTNGTWQEWKSANCLAKHLVGHEASCLPLILEQLRSTDPVERRHGCRILDQMRGAAFAAMPALSLLAKDDTDATVREAAQDALVKIRGK